MVAPEAAEIAFKVTVDAIAIEVQTGLLVVGAAPLIVQ